MTVEREDEIQGALRDILGPKAGVDAMTQSIIKDIIGDKRSAEVDMVLTPQVCLLANYLTDQIKHQVEGLYGDGI